MFSIENMGCNISNSCTGQHIGIPMDYTSSHITVERAIFSHFYLTNDASCVSMYITMSSTKFLYAL